MGGELGIPAQSHAENIIADIRINLILPNTNFACTGGQSFQSLGTNISQIQNKLSEIVRNVDPNAPGAVTIRKAAAIIAVVVAFVIFLAIAFSVGEFAILGGCMLIALISAISYTCWKRRFGKEWRDKVFPILTNYIKNDLKELLPENVERHIIYPINRYRRNEGIVAIWMVIRLTHGQIQQPVYGPIYWSSNGVVSQAFPFVTQQPQVQQQVVQQQQQQVNMQQQLQQMVQQQQQQIQQLQQLVVDKQQITPNQQPQNENEEGIGIGIGQQTQEYQQPTNNE